MPKGRPEKPVQKRHEEYAERIIAMLEKGMAPWQKNWEAGAFHPPFNPVSGTVYSGINRVMLSEFDYADPRWMSFRQASAEGYRVKKGSKSHPVVHWQWTETVDKLDEDGRPVLDADGEPEKEVMLLGRPRIRFFSVFHASQLEMANGQPIPPFEPKELAWNPNERAEALLQASGANIIHDQRDRAHYLIQSDEIHLPPKEKFADEGKYYPIAFHELGHWTRHSSRLNRENGPFGSEMYAREELKVHIASWMLSQDLGIAFNSDHHASYLQNWLTVLKKDPYEIFRACGDAERIKQYVLGLEQKQEQAAEIVFTESANEESQAPDMGQTASPEPEPSTLDTAFLMKTIDKITRHNALAEGEEATRRALAETKSLLIKAVASPSYNAPGTEMQSAIIKSMHYRCSLHDISSDPAWLLNSLNYSIVALGNIQANILNSDGREANLAKLAAYNKDMGPREMGLASGQLTDFKRDLDGKVKDWCWDRETGTIMCRENTNSPWRLLDQDEKEQLRGNDHEANLVPVLRLADGRVMTYDGRLHGNSLVRETPREVDTELIARYLEKSASRMAAAIEEKGLSHSAQVDLLREVVAEGQNIIDRPAFTAVAHTQDAAMLKHIVHSLASFMEPSLYIPPDAVPFMLNDVLMMGTINAKQMADHVLAGRFQAAIESNIRESFANDPEKADSMIPLMTGRKVQFDHGLASGRLWCRRLNDGAAMYKNHEHDLWIKDNSGKLKEDFPGPGRPPITPILQIDDKSFLTLDGGRYSINPEKKAELDNSEREMDDFHRTTYVNGVLELLVRPNLLTARRNVFSAMLGSIEEARSADFNRGDAAFNNFLNQIEKIGQRELEASAADPDSVLTLAQIEGRVANSVLEVVAASRELGYRGLDYAANELPGPKYRLAPLCPAGDGEKTADLQFRGQTIRGLREARSGETARVFAVAHQNGNEVIAGFDSRSVAEGFAKALNGRELSFIDIPVPRYSDEKVMLEVPFPEKEEAKSRGATWDREVKKWCARPGTDLTLLAKWIPRELEQAPDSPKWYRELTRPDDFAYLYGSLANLAPGDDPKQIGQLEEVYSRFVNRISEIVTDKLGEDKVLERSRTRLANLLLETHMLHGKMIELGLLPPDSRFQHQELAEGILDREKQHDQTVAAKDSGQADHPELATEVVYLQVPYKERNEAKKAGARWDKDKKLWYAPVGTDLGKLAKFLPEKEPVPAPVVSPVGEFRQLLESNGFILNGDPIMDGKIHRVPVEGKLKQRDGAYQAHSDGVPNGWFENHRTGLGEPTKWVYSGQKLTAEQTKALRADMDRKLEEDRKNIERQYAKAAERAWEKFANCAAIPVDPDHPYLKSKGVGDYGLRQDQDGNLLVFGLNLDKSDFPGRAPSEIIRPSLDDLTVTRHIQTVQTISPDGEKRFEYGSRKKGAVHLIGESKFKKIAYDQAYQTPSLFDDLKEQPEILLAEGYATGASLHKATGLPVAVAFDAGNLLPVAEALRRKFPKANLTICADNDRPLVLKAITDELGEVKVTPELEKEYAHHNKGVVLAVKAAQAVNARVIVPQFTEDEKAKGLTDFNDLAQSRGVFAVTQIVSPRHRSQATFVDLGGQADQPATGHSAGMAM